MKKISQVLISVYHKEGLDPVLEKFHQNNVKIWSTGGTYDYIKQKGYPVETVESLTSFPSILGGRVKTLHPTVMGGILARRENEEDQRQVQEYQLCLFDAVIVDLYPFEETLAQTSDPDLIIEKIDIGGISLIRAAAKNFRDVLVVPSQAQYKQFLQLLTEKGNFSDIEDRKFFAMKAFQVSSKYDSAIFNYFSENQPYTSLRMAIDEPSILRYGENPHQKGSFFGNLNEVFDQYHGKELSFNNLLDTDAALQLMSDFTEGGIAIIKHNNACGLTLNEDPIQAWTQALAADPISAFGGIIYSNRKIELSLAEEIQKLFFEILIAPEYSQDALACLKTKKNRIILRQKKFEQNPVQMRSLLNGMLVQEWDKKAEIADDLRLVTTKEATPHEIQDLVFANKIVKHTKSNAIVLAKNNSLMASGTGQTSRVDALEQAIAKAKKFGFDLRGAVMASDAFFPFSDCVKIAYKAGITAVIQPGGSVKDTDSINFCNQNNMAMYFTGYRHFKH